MTLYSCSYQPPIPADQVRPAAEFDQDAGVLLLVRKLVLHFPYFFYVMNLLYLNSTEAIPSGRGRGRGRRGRGRGRGIYLPGYTSYCNVNMFLQVMLGLSFEVLISDF